MPNKKTYQLVHTHLIKKFIKKSKQPQERDRARAIWMLINGKPRKEVAHLMQRHIATIGRWHHKFLAHGIQGIKNPRYGGNHFRLSPRQKQHLKTLVLTKTPRDMNLSTQELWDTSSLKKLISRRYKVHYSSPASYRKLFYHWGFRFIPTWQNPQGISGYLPNANLNHDEYHKRKK